MIGIVTDTVYIWPDASWMYAHEYSDWQDAWKGDDYAIVEAPVDATEEDIDAIALRVANGGA